MCARHVDCQCLFYYPQAARRKADVYTGSNLFEGSRRSSDVINRCEIGHVVVLLSRTKTCAMSVWSEAHARRCECHPNTILFGMILRRCSAVARVCYYCTPLWLTFAEKVKCGGRYIVFLALDGKLLAQLLTELGTGILLVPYLFKILCMTKKS